MLASLVSLAEVGGCTDAPGSWPGAVSAAVLIGSFSGSARPRTWSVPANCHPCRAARSRQIPLSRVRSGLDGSAAGTYKEVVPAGKRRVDWRTGNHVGLEFAWGPDRVCVAATGAWVIAIMARRIPLGDLPGTTVPVCYMTASFLPTGIR